MLIKLIVFVLIAAIIWRLLKNSNDTAKRNNIKAHLRRLAVPTLLLLLVLLVISGHLPWLVAIVASLFAALKTASPWLIRALPLLSSRKQKKQQQEKTHAEEKTMDVQEACSILDLSHRPLCRSDVIQSHRRLMQKLHPDRGGSDYLAGRINLARDVLLAHLQQQA